jgi:hypothetical protein
VIWESQSLTILLGVPKWHSTYSKKSSAKSAAVVSSHIGMNNAYFVTRHTIVSMLLYSWPFLMDGGKPVIQSRLISLNGEFHISVGIRRGSNWLYGQ